MTDRPSVVFRPGERGLRKVFGELEAQVMDVIWRRGRVTVQDVWAELEKDRELAYATVKTVMNRLADKGYLKRQAKERAYSYEPVMEREAFLQHVSAEVLEGLFVDFGEPIHAHLVEALRTRDFRGLARLEGLIRDAKRRRP